jgi:aspartate/methionine/tyrosine aminotransferase
LENGIRHGVVFVPGTVYGAEPGSVRLTYARPPIDEIALGAAKFAEALRTTLSVRK